MINRTPSIQARMPAVATRSFAGNGGPLAINCNASPAWARFLRGEKANPLDIENAAKPTLADGTETFLPTVFDARKSLAAVPPSRKEVTTRAVAPAAFGAFFGSGFGFIGAISYLGFDKPEFAAAAITGAVFSSVFGISATTHALSYGSRLSRSDRNKKISNLLANAASVASGIATSVATAAAVSSGASFSEALISGALAFIGSAGLGISGLVVKAKRHAVKTQKAYEELKPHADKLVTDHSERIADPESVKEYLKELAFGNQFIFEKLVEDIVCESRINSKIDFLESVVLELQNVLDVDRRVAETFDAGQLDKARILYAEKVAEFENLKLIRDRIQTLTSEISDLVNDLREFERKKRAAQDTLARLNEINAPRARISELYIGALSITGLSEAGAVMMAGRETIECSDEIEARLKELANLLIALPFQQI